MNRETRDLFEHVQLKDCLCGTSLSFYTGGVLEWHCLLLREHIKKNLRNDEYDLVIIGGGITGAGIALDASERGMKVALVEMQDFAQGTSSRSTKLVHGGLRYLKQFQIGVVAETGKNVRLFMKMGLMLRLQSGCFYQCIKVEHLVNSQHQLV